MSMQSDTLPTISEAIRTAPLSRRLIAWRQLVGLTQAEAAKRWGIHPGTLSRFEKGEEPGRVSVRRVICDDVGIDHGEEWA